MLERIAFVLQEFIPSKRVFVGKMITWNHFLISHLILNMKWSMKFIKWVLKYSQGNERGIGTFNIKCSKRKAGFEVSCLVIRQYR